MQKTIFSALLLLLLSQQVTAQAPFFSYNLYRYNPAAAATSSEWAATVDYNFYAGKMVGFPQNLALNAEMKVSSYGAIGLNTNAYSSMEGYFKRNDVNLSYAHQWKLSKKEKPATLALGVESGVSIRPVLYSTHFGEAYNRKNFLNLNTGILLYLPNQKFYIGISSKDMLQPYRFTANKYPYSFYYMYYQFMSGCRFEIGKDFSLQPNIMITKIFHNLLGNYYDRFDVNLQLQHRKWEIGASYSSKLFIGINAGICITKRLYLRTSYNFITSRLNQYDGISNINFMLAYRSIK